MQVTTRTRRTFVLFLSWLLPYRTTHFLQQVALSLVKLLTTFCAESIFSADTFSAVSGAKRKRFCRNEKNRTSNGAYYPVCILPVYCPVGLASTLRSKGTSKLCLAVFIAFQITNISYKRHTAQPLSACHSRSFRARPERLLHLLRPQGVQHFPA